MMRKRSGMSDESRKILLNLVERYEKGHGELQSTIGKLNDSFIELRVEVKNMQTQIDKLETSSITVAELTPIKLLVYGATGIILAGFIGALVTFFIKGK